MLCCYLDSPCPRRINLHQSCPESALYRSILCSTCSPSGKSNHHYHQPAPLPRGRNRNVAGSQVYKHLSTVIFLL